MHCFVEKTLARLYTNGVGATLALWEAMAVGSLNGYDQIALSPTTA